MKILLVFCTFLVCQPVFSQILLSGIVKDSSSKNSIESVSVRLKDESIGTVSNINGEFQIEVSSLPIALVFSHVGYKSVLIEIIDETPIDLYLSLNIIQLNEVVTGNPAIALLNSAINKALIDSAKSNHCRIFYQKISKEKDKATSIHELFFDAVWKTYGIDKFKIIESRYATRDEKRFRFQIISISALMNTGLLRKSIFSPNNERNDKVMYKLNVEKYIGTEGDEVAVIYCTPNKREGYFFEGLIYINTLTNDFVKIEGEFHRPKPPIKKIKNEYDAFVVNFRTNNQGKVVFNDLKFSKNLVFKGNNTVVEEIKILAYMYDDNISIKGMYPLSSSQHVSNLKTTYKPEFWRDNEVIKKTPFEKEIISDLEKSKSFDSNFIK
jgi:hypothetical protein